MTPIVGSERTQPGHPLSIVTDWSVDARDWVLPMHRVGRVAGARLRPHPVNHFGDRGRTGGRWA